MIVDPTDAGRLDSDHRARLVARQRLGTSCTWDAVGLPAFRRIGVTAGDRSIIGKVPKASRFFKYDWEHLADPDLFGAIRSRLHLGRTLWPRAVRSPAWNRPVILHHGLAEKFTTKRDNAHLHLVSMAQQTIEEPAEGWINEYNGSYNLHLLAPYRIAHAVLTQMVCVDTETAICTTAYHLTPGAEDAKRKGFYQYASWAATP
jgi:hypothetical protein